MLDISAISAGLSSMKVAIDIAKGLKDSTTAIKDATANFKIAELLVAMSEVKMHLIDAKDENIELKEKIKELEGALNQKDEVIFRDGYYYLSAPQSGKPEGPFCSNCYSSKNVLTLLTEVTGTFRRFGKYKCPSCGERFEN
jgi:hypothetical protein